MNIDNMKIFYSLLKSTSKSLIWPTPSGGLSSVLPMDRNHAIPMDDVALSLAMKEFFAVRRVVWSEGHEGIRESGEGFPH